jgi:predicted enzyme involved in methoxymalonyl-ACP biosynthesis
MSCRVLKRGVEEYVLNYIVEQLQKRGCNTVVGEYLPTAKNKLVENHYPNLGFAKTEENIFQVDVNNFSFFNHFINNN